MNIVAALWLFFSAFSWPHNRALRTDTSLVAVLMFIVAIWATSKPALRFANTVLAVWLFVSSFFLRPTNGALWNNTLVAIVVFVLSLIPASSGTARPGRPAATRT